MKSYAIITGKARYDLELQIMVHSEAQAKREVKDLEQMGIDDVRYKVFETEARAYTWLEKNQ